MLAILQTVINSALDSDNNKVHHSRLSAIQESKEKPVPRITQLHSTSCFDLPCNDWCQEGDETCGAFTRHLGMLHACLCSVAADVSIAAMTELELMFAKGQQIVTLAHQVGFVLPNNV